MILSITPGAELPDRTLTWEDPDGTPVNFQESPHTFRLELAFPEPVTKTDGVTGGADGLVTIAFTPNETADFPSGLHRAVLWATRTSDNKDREPARLMLYVRKD